MKKLAVIIISFFTIFTYNWYVSAKDTVYSINKYTEEKFEFIKKSYNKENKNDGYIVAGKYLKETIQKDSREYDDYQIMLVKYDMSGKKIWEFTYGKSLNDTMNSLTYTYDSTGNIDGYLLVMSNSDDDYEETSYKTIFLKIDLNGKLIFEKEEKNMNNINQIKETFTDEDNFNGYIAVGETKENDKTNGLIVKLDQNLNIIWQKEYDNESDKKNSFSDIIALKNNEKIDNYIIVNEKTTESEQKVYQILKYDQEGNLIKIILEDEYINSSLKVLETNDSYIIYGLTEDVKLSRENAVSYYLKKYNMNDEEEWETIGNVELKIDASFKLLPLTEKEEITEYLLMYHNEKDKSTEIVKINKDGLIQNKVKKISNEYYDITNFDTNNDIIYFIGQINCPEDDTCDYDSNSLFLISDEDKVIEVKDTDSKNILLASSIVILLIILLITLKKRKKKLKIN